MGLQGNPSSSPYAILGTISQKIDDLSAQITLCVKQKIESKKVRFSSLSKQVLTFKPTHHIAILKEKLRSLSAHLKAIDPRTLLTQGYCILFHEKNDSVILSCKELKEEDTIHIRLHDGNIKTIVKEVYDL
jgi:exodeoxyribonuclease VII large subunit